MNYCDWCGNALTDRRGNPRFEIFTGADSKLDFVCRNGCPPSRVLARRLHEVRELRTDWIGDPEVLTGVA